MQAIFLDISAGKQGVHGSGVSVTGRQADLLKELDVGEQFNSDDISELRRTADLALRTTMAALVAAERHLWLTLSDMKEKDRVFLMDAPFEP